MAIPLSIQPGFWLMALLIGWLNSETFMGTVIWMFIAFISVLAHEYGHALTARAFGKEATIELSFFGGMTRHDQVNSLRGWQELLIVLNGPLAGLSLAAIAYLALSFGEAKLQGPLLYFLQSLFIINVFWSFLNLLPIYPLDGGQLLTISLKSLFGARGFSAGLLICTICGFLLASIGLILHALFASMIGFLLSFESYRSWRASVAMKDIDYQPLYRQELARAEEFINVGELDKASAILLKLTVTTERGLIHDTAIAHLASLYLLQGRYQAAYSLLLPYSDKLTEAMLPLFVRSAHLCGDWKNAASHGNKAYQQSPSYRIALMNALSHAHLNDPVPTVGWLRRAKADGAPDMYHMISQREFDPVRPSTAFQQFCHEIRPD